MGGTAHRLEGETPSQYDQHSRVIECPSSLLREIRATVLERFNSLPHGGTEIFGVLFGTHNDSGVRITGFRALITDHEFAHPGELSDEECAAFASAMPASTGETGVSPVAAVGWFRSHPRSALTLSERDLEIANALFPQPWQVTLVLRPGNSAMTRGRIFFRESGPLSTGAGFQEFTVDPLGGEMPRESAMPMAPMAELPRVPEARVPVPEARVQDALPRQDAGPQWDTSPRMASPPVLAAPADSAERTPEIHRESPRAPEAQQIGRAHV